MESDATALQQPSETMSNDAAKRMPERSTFREPVKAAPIVSPTESQIATVAYQLWLRKGCRVGWDQEDWFQAEAMLKEALVANREDLSGRPSIPGYDIYTESEILVEFQWEGHWEVWEREWGSALWIWD